jgi:pyruvate kinase
MTHFRQETTAFNADSISPEIPSVLTQSSRLPLTKIVATVGPASESPEILTRLIQAGVTTFRLNFSHGDHATHERVYNTIRQVARELDQPTTILQDLQGPKLRIGELKDNTPFVINDGDEFIICTNPVEGTATRVSTSYEHLAQDVRLGDQILIDDGLIELKVNDTRFDTEFGDEVICTVIHGGEVKAHKGINLPGTAVSAPALTPKDLEDLELGIGLGVDMVALSFVRSTQDVELAKQHIQRLGGTQPLISKIEKPQAIRELEAIVHASDGLMVARGDLGVELSADQVPLIQKRLIRLANQAGKPVITATQMLESMIQNPRPTRAEASDIANAILDGTDALMLSGETAVGKWPVRTVETMNRIACTIERDASWRIAMKANVLPTAEPVSASDVSIAVARAAGDLAVNVGAVAIVVVTNSGATVQSVSQQRPGIPILAFADRRDIAARLSLWHGIIPVCEELATDPGQLVDQLDSGLRRLGYASTGDRVVLLASTPRANDSRGIFLECHNLA